MAKELDSLEKATRGLPIWVKSIVFIIVGVAISYTTYKTILMDMFPEAFEKNIESAVIHKDFKLWSDSMEVILRSKFKEELEIANKEHDKLLMENIGLQKQINNLKKEIKVFQEGCINQVNFNTHNIGTNSQAIFELMDDDKDCKGVRYTRGRVDRYMIWDEDYHDYSTLQRTTASSGCVGTIHPYGRQRIKIKFKKQN